METRKLLWFMALAFSLVLLVQHIELPYGYVMSSLLSIGKSEVASSSSFSTSGFSNESDSSGFVFNNVINDEKKLGKGKNTTDSLSSDDSVDQHSSTDFLETNHPRNESLAAETGIEHVHDSPVSSNTSMRNSSAESLQGPNAAPSSMTQLSSSFSTSGNESDSVAKDEKKSENRKNLTDSLSRDDSVDQHSSTDFLETNHPRNESLAAETEIEHVHDLPASSYTSVRNFSAESPQGPNAAPSSITEYDGLNKSTASTVDDPAVSVQNKEKTTLGPSQLSTEVNSSAIKRFPELKRFKGAPSVVVPILKMDELLSESQASYHSTKARWPSQADKELMNAKKLIQSADSVEKNIVYRNISSFRRSYKLMEKTLKIYVYSEGKRPIFHEPELNGIYASEGWFMKQLEESKRFVTKNGEKAHLFYLPFSARVLQKVLYVPGSHSRENLVRYLGSYLKNISTTHRFWNRTDGADHFLAACHDWAPSETGQIMSNCMRALCNANIKSFNFSKDVSLPVTNVHKNATTPLKSPGGKPPSQRKILAFFAGQMHGYLRPILLDYWENKDPDIKISGKLPKSKDEMTYVQYMKSSKYCICARGYEPNTPRVVEAIFYECVPVMLSDNYVPPFFETLNWESFAVFVPEKDIPNLKKILASIPEKRYVEMQKRVKMVQKHFLWHEKALKFDVFHMILHSLWYTRVLHIGS